jgi:SAM-dependent methyltransferase
MAVPVDLTCRLCGSTTDRIFEAVLFGQPTGYHRCHQCRALQTDEPGWLAEAYSDSHLSQRDTGAVERCLQSQAIVLIISRLLGLRRDASILDFGGGSGLLCRLLRDIGFDCYVEDEYSEPHFAAAFASRVELRQFDIITMVEVAEHLPNPGAAFARLLARRPDVLLIQTETFRNQGKDWSYLALSDGQHVFFYARESMRYIANMAGFHYQPFGDIHLLTRRPIQRWRRRLLSRALRPHSLRWVRGAIAWRSSFLSAARDQSEIDRRPTGQ